MACHEQHRWLYRRVLGNEHGHAGVRHRLAVAGHRAGEGAGIDAVDPVADICDAAGRAVADGEVAAQAGLAIGGNAEVRLGLARDQPQHRLP